VKELGLGTPILTDARGNGFVVLGRGTNVNGRIGARFRVKKTTKNQGVRQRVLVP
jgi:hypothetical protein